MKKPVIQVSVYGDVSEMVLTKAAENVRNDLMQMPGISQVSLVGNREYEILVEIAETTLRKYGLTLEQVANLVKTILSISPQGTWKRDPETFGSGPKDSSTPPKNSRTSSYYRRRGARRSNWAKSQPFGTPSRMWTFGRE